MLVSRVSRKHMKKTLLKISIGENDPEYHWTHQELRKHWSQRPLQGQQPDRPFDALERSRSRNKAVGRSELRLLTLSDGVQILSDAIDKRRNVRILSDPRLSAHQKSIHEMQHRPRICDALDSAFGIQTSGTDATNCNE